MVDKKKTATKKRAPKKRAAKKAPAPVGTMGIHGDLNTKPYCGQCGWHVGEWAPDMYGDGTCDACGADLSLYGWGPANPPSLSNATGLDGKVSFSWSEVPAQYPQGYQLRYQTSIDFEWVVVDSPTSPYEVSVVNGTTVCGQLRGKAENIWSAWSAEKCATATP
jgi:hypothetical protein